MRILVTGSRLWQDGELIHNVLYGYASGQDGWGYDPLLVVHGDCPVGADAMAEASCRELDVATERHPADWETYGKSAGFRRNAEMVRLGADICLAFIHADSRGATHTKDLALKAGIPTRIFRESADWVYLGEIYLGETYV